MKNKKKNTAASVVVCTPHYCCCTTHGTDFHLRWHHFPLLSQWGVKCLSVSVWERPPAGPTDLCTHWPPPAFIGILGESQMRLVKMQSHSCLAFLNGHFQAGEDYTVKEQSGAKSSYFTLGYVDGWVNSKADEIELIFFLHSVYSNIAVYWVLQ